MISNPKKVIFYSKLTFCILSQIFLNSVAAKSIIPFQPRENYLEVPNNNSNVSEKCDLPSDSLSVSEKPNISLAVQNEFSSEDFIMLPCKSKYFFMKFQTVGSADVQIWFSGGKRGSGYPNLKVGVPLSTGYPSYVWPITSNDSKQIYGNYFFTDPIKNISASNIEYYIKYDKSGITTGVNGNVIMKYSSINSSLTKIFSQKNIYIRLVSRMTVLSIKNININCLADTSCIKPPISNKLEIPLKTNKNANITCSNNSEHINMVQNYHNITYPIKNDLFLGRAFKNRDNSTQIIIPNRTGAFNVTFSVTKNAEFQLYLYNNDFFGTTFEYAHINLKSGVWKLGNFFESQSIDKDFQPEICKIYFTLDPSGITIGYDKKVVEKLDYSNFSMDDMLLKPNLYFFFYSLSDNTTFSNIKVKHISRECNKLSEKSNSLIESSSKKIFQRKYFYKRNSVKSESKEPPKRKNRMALQAAHNLKLLQQKNSNNSDDSEITVNSVNSDSLKNSTNQKISDFDTNDVIRYTTVKSSKPKNYSLQKAINIPCFGGDFGFSAKIETQSDIFIALADSKKSKNSTGYIEIKIGYNSDHSIDYQKSEIAQTNNGLMKRSKEQNLIITYIEKSLTVYINNKILTRNNINQLEINSIIIAPSSGTANVESIFVCSNYDES
ncbi:hypothetical protein BB561_004539 [Smittium simulii]|uniref:Galectin domain-containing protein n=1 Tax=Smittium simulii TaxID=133385 RepID=A0A2T9YFQ3_9FUNG|nr:hypothetical protein BB561_004539 [Smittium simulii]